MKYGDGIASPLSLLGGGGRGGVGGWGGGKESPYLLPPSLLLYIPVHIERCKRESGIIIDSQLLIAIMEIYGLR